MRLTKEQKRWKRIKRYLKELDRLDRSAYGEWKQHYRGFPQGAEHTRKYGERRKRRRK